MQRRGTRSSTTRFFYLTAALAWLGQAPALASAQTAPQGMWLDQTGHAGILIAPCGSQLCGRIEWLKLPLTGPATDVHNPDATLQNRPLCGLTMLGGFVADGSGGWTSGWIYDPEKGKTYKSEMHAGTDGTLRVRGYIGTPMLGRTEIWTRPLSALPPCTAP